MFWINGKMNDHRSSFLQTDVKCEFQIEQNFFSKSIKFFTEFHCFSKTKKN